MVRVARYKITILTKWLIPDNVRHLNHLLSEEQYVENLSGFLKAGPQIYLGGPGGCGPYLLSN